MARRDLYMPATEAVAGTSATQSPSSGEKRGMQGVRKSKVPHIWRPAFPGMVGLLPSWTQLCSALAFTTREGRDQA